MEKEQIFTPIDNKSFSEFEQAIKTELDTKIANSDTMTHSKNEFEKIQKIKDVFAQINNEYKEPEDMGEPPEPPNKEETE